MRIRKRRGGAKLLAIASCAAAGLVAAPSAGAVVTVGQVAQGNPLPCTTNADRLQPVVSSGSYVAPFAGTITSWSTRAGQGTGLMALKVFRLVGGVDYTVIGQDGARALTAGAVNTFPTSVTVRAGDVIGLHTVGSVACISASPGDNYLARAGHLAVGQTGTFTTGSPATPNNRLNISAVLDPTNTFSIGALTRNKKKGTASTLVTVPNPGTLTLSGGGAQFRQASAPGPGPVLLTVKAKGKKKKQKLSSTGQVKVNPTITFTPTGGSPASQTLKVQLKKNI